MRRVLVIFAVIFILAISAFAAKGDMKIGPHVGLTVPTGDAGDAYNFSPRFGAKFIYGLNDEMAIEGNAAYSLLQPDSDWDPEGFSASIIEIAGGFRYHFQPQFYGVGGLGMYMFSWSWEYDYGMYGGVQEVDDSDSEIGLFVGAGYIAEMKSFDLEPVAKFHLIDGDLWMSLAVGLNFNIGN